MKPEQLYRLEQQWAGLWRDGQALALLLGRQPEQREQMLQRLLTCVPPGCEVVVLADENIPLGDALWQQLAGESGNGVPQHAVELLARLPRHPLLLVVNAAERRTVAELDELRQFVLAALADQRQIGLLLGARPGFLRLLRRPALRGLQQLLVKHWRLDRDYRSPAVALGLAVLGLAGLAAWYSGALVPPVATVAPDAPVVAPSVQPVVPAPDQVTEVPRVMQLDWRLSEAGDPASAVKSR